MDLLVAATLSLISGVTFLESWHRVHYPDVMAVAGVVASIAAGPYYLWRRGRQPIVPITAIYAVLMFFAIFVADFLVSASFGRVNL